MPQTESEKAWYQRNKELTKARAAAWAKNNPEKRNRIQRESRHRHAVARREYSQNYRETHPDVVAKQRKSTIKWKHEHPEKAVATQSKRRTAKTKAGGAYTSEQWIALCNKYENKCLCCDKKKKLTPDHVVPVSKGGTSDISNIQHLCGPCNSSKGAKTVDYRREINNARRSVRSNRSRG